MQVVLRDVRFERDGRCVLDIPALQLRSGATTAILGPNGSGKTTLLRLLAGLQKPQRGTVRLGDGPVVPGRDVAYLFQEQVFLRRSVRENLELGLRMRAVGRTERRTRIDEALKLLGISDLMDRRADRLSGGEGRRVDLARALCLRAPLVLLDEPLEGLDRRTQARLLDELPHVLAAFDATTVLVTHNREEAFRLADDLVVLADGQVRAAGAKNDVATNPRLETVADVLGYIVLDVDGRRMAVPPGAFSLVPVDAAAPVDVAAPVGAARAFSGSRTQGDGYWTLHVENVSDLIEWQEVVGRIGSTSVRVPIQPGTPLPKPGDRVRVCAERVYAVDEG